MVYPFSPSHQKIQKDLYRAVDNHQMSHAQLFASSEGSPSITLAYKVVTYLHCLNKQADQACNQCSACTKMHKLIHPDHHHLFPIGNSSSQEQSLHASLPHWRTFLQEQPYGNLQDWSEHIGSEARKLQINKDQVDYLRNVLNQKPFEGSCKTILIWLPEHLNLVAANKMLKMVEEPTPQTYFFFITTSPHQILPTLRSRIWLVSIPAWKDEALLAILQQEYAGASQKQLTETLHIAQGNLNLAKKILSGGTQPYFEPVTNWFRDIYAQQFDKLAQAAETFHNHQPSMQKNWLIYTLQLLRATLRISLGNTLINLTQEENTFCKKFHATIDIHTIPTMILHIDQLGKVLERHANAKLAFIYTSFAIMNLLSPKVQT